jgi:hypothetical protein
LASIRRCQCSRNMLRFLMLELQNPRKIPTADDKKKTPRSQPPNRIMENHDMGIGSLTFRSPLRTTRFDHGGVVHNSSRHDSGA